MRLIDADKLMKEAYSSDEWDRRTQQFDLPVVDIYTIDEAPTIKTKQIKYYDEDESVWKVGSVIVDE